MEHRELQIDEISSICNKLIVVSCFLFLAQRAKTVGVVGDSERLTNLLDGLNIFQPFGFAVKFSFLRLGSEKGVLI